MYIGTRAYTWTICDRSGGRVGVIDLLMDFSVDRWLDGEPRVSCHEAYLKDPETGEAEKVGLFEAASFLPALLKAQGVRQKGPFRHRSFFVKFAALAMNAAIADSEWAGACIKEAGFLYVGGGPNDPDGKWIMEE